MALRRTKRFLVAIVVLIVLGVVLPPSISVGRYKGKIVHALSRAVGRDVTVGSISARLLPQPGFTLENFVLAEDPHFGGEPMLRANEVVATLRLTSLWRGRLEIATLSLKDPSLNLVRSDDGRWNVESLLLRAAQTPTAPTAKPRPEARTRFPYIEATGGRINFKLGQEKKVWALTDADFALWLASEDEWRTRLVARPVRTDATLSDTGLMRVNGSVQRAQNAGATPLKFHLTLQDAQLGQLTTLIYGHDRGWRGATNGTFDFAGTPAHLALAASVAVDGFRRYDITPSDSLRLEARCVSDYWSNEHRLAGLECHLPADNGEIAARGAVNEVFGNPQYDLSFTARDVPMSYAVAFARRAKKDLPSDLTAGGVLNAALSLQTIDGHSTWLGGGGTNDFTLTSAVLQTPLTLGSVEFAVQPQNVPKPSPRRSRPVLVLPPSAAVTIPEFPVLLGTAQPAMAKAVLDAKGYSVNITGSAALSRLMQVARAAGVAAPATAVQGMATRMALEIAGEWRGFQQPVVTGSSDVRNARFDIAGVAAPIQIGSATVSLDAVQVQVQNLVASAGPVAFGGTIRQSRGCASPVPCRAEFALHADRVDMDDVNRLLNPRLHSEPWYRRIAGGDSAPGVLARLHAEGQISVARLLVKNVALQNVGATLKLDPDAVQLTSASASLFGGTVQGDWRGDFSGATPVYAGSGSVHRVALAQVSAAMHDNWASGSADAQYQVSATGWTSADLWRSATATLDFDWHDGSIRRLALAQVSARPMARGDSTLHIRDFRGRAEFRDGVLAISGGKMETPTGLYSVAGTATSARELALTFTLNSKQQYNVRGPLDAPRIEAIALPPRTASVER